MKFFSIFVLALALATTVNAQFGLMGGLAGNMAGGLARRGLGAAGNGIMNRLGFGGPEPLPEGKIGTTLYNALVRVPGTQRFLKSTTRALAEYLNALQDDLSNLIGLDTSNMDPQRRGIVGTALNGLTNGLQRLIRAVTNLASGLNGVSDIMMLPFNIVQEVFGVVYDIFSNIFSLLTNGVSYQSIIPTSVPKLWDLIKAIFSDVMTSPAAFTRLAMKMVAPGPVARFL